MPARDILKRMTANLAGFRIKSLREMPTKREMDLLDAAVMSLYSMPLIIVDNISSLTAIEAEARRLIRLKRADVVIVDYLQLVENSGPETREACMAETARKFKNLALAGQCAVLTASQLNEDGKLRESRAIGHHADFVINIEDSSLVLARTAGEHATCQYL
jgi:replicative DNA helicase